MQHASCLRAVLVVLMATSLALPAFAQDVDISPEHVKIGTRVYSPYLVFGKVWLSKPAILPGKPPQSRRGTVCHLLYMSANLLYFLTSRQGETGSVMGLGEHG